MSDLEEYDDRYYSTNTDDSREDFDPSCDVKFKAWKDDLLNNLKSNLVSNVLTDKEKGFIGHIFEARETKKGLSIEDLCFAWQLPWPIIRGLIERELLKPSLDWEPLITDKATFGYKINGIIMPMGEIERYEQEKTQLRDSRGSYQQRKYEKHIYDLSLLLSCSEQENARIGLELCRCEEENASLTKELKRLKSVSDGGIVAHSDCAACKAEESHVDEWTQDLECAVMLACSFVKSGESNSTAFHEAEWKTLRGATRKRAFEAFRRALPDHLKEADPKKK